MSAGHGYDYLIRQVAALDATHRGRTDLASYYTERGEAPGRWVGRGLAGVDGLDVGDVVTGDQMWLLFAEGRHPLADTSSGGGGVLALGVPYRPSSGERPFLAALRARFADHNTELGLPRRAALPAEVRARLRGELAAEWFRQQEGRDPKGDLELASALARWSRLDHGRPPGRVEMLQLAQQATLETRDRKHEPRTLAEQRAVWRTEAVETLGGGHEIEEMLRRTLNPPALRPVPTVTAGWRTEIADRVVAALEEHRATWQYWHLWAETQRQLRGCGINPADGATAVVEEAINRSIRLTLVEDPAGLPDHLRRTDGASEFTVAGSDQYTSTRILAAEQHLLAAAGRTDGRMLNPVAVDLGLREATAGGTTLDAGQTSMVQTLATDRRQVQLVIAPAGAGKTTALKVLADTWTGGGGDILGLAPSATAAAQLAEATGITADTLHRLTWAIQHGHPLPEWADRIGPKTLLLIDEAGMADTLTLDTAVTHVVQRGGRVCLVGDDQQLGAVGAGGIPADLDAAHGAVRLTQLHRFTDPDEAAATLHIRDGAPDAVDFYTARDRIRIGDPDGLPDRILAAWRHDQNQGLDSLMLPRPAGRSPTSTSAPGPPGSPATRTPGWLNSRTGTMPVPVT